MEECDSCCRQFQEESDSDCCSCDTCSCESGSCCESPSCSECSSCSCSPRANTEVDDKYIQDLDAIKAFVADIAGFIRQNKDTAENANVIPKPEKEAEYEVEQAPKVVQEQAYALPEASPAPQAPMDLALMREIAHIEEIINNTEMNLQNNYAYDGTMPLGVPAHCYMSPRAESPYSYGASTALASDMYHCNTNDHTVTDSFSNTCSPISAAHAPWRSGFEMPAYGMQWEDDRDDQELDLDTLHAHMVSLDIYSYMYLVETVLDERVRREMAAAC
ncbi:hypothetical protein X943_000636 [Babesia divergens]|uniref:Uncharacterized protein n=1 Tax=Babesia divergens TaxID=32595 RepID=A0AAD9GH50_BABDI|nr:hypothetical protein X943_000636 [Babesia divergens]